MNRGFARIVVLAISLALLVGCGRDLPSGGPGSPPTTGVDAPPAGAAPGFDSACLATSLGPEEITAVVAFDRRRDAAVVARNATEPFTSASLVKLLIAIDRLSRTGNDADGEVARMLAASDDGIASRLWSEGGATAIVERMAERMELADTAPPADPGVWGNTETTAADLVRVYRYLLEDARGEVRRVVLAALRATTEFADDGFAQRFGIPDAAGTARPWASKQGWSCTSKSRNLHSAGVVGPADRYVVVALSTRPSDETSWASASRALTDEVGAVLAGLPR